MAMVVALTQTQAANLDNLHSEKASAVELQAQIDQLTQERANAHENERAVIRSNNAMLNQRKQSGQVIAQQTAAHRQAQAVALKEEARRRTQERAAARAQERQRILQENAAMRDRVAQRQQATDRAAFERNAHGEALHQHAQARLGERQRQKAEQESEIAHLNAEGEGRRNNSVPAIYKAAVDKREKGRQLAQVHRHEAMLEMGHSRSMDEDTARWVASKQLPEWSTTDAKTWSPPSGFDARSKARSTFDAWTKAACSPLAPASPSPRASPRQGSKPILLTASSSASSLPVPSPRILTPSSVRTGGAGTPKLASSASSLSASPRAPGTPSPSAANKPMKAWR